MEKKKVIEQDDQVWFMNPILAQVGLTPAESTALKSQGFVSAETRGQRCTVYKLRFRIDGRQRVLYLGTNPLVADAVRAALRSLQKARRTRRNLRALIDQANRLLRESKSQLLADAKQEGYRFHGRALRRPRRPASTNSVPIKS